jgi:hypothetical protein
VNLVLRDKGTSVVPNPNGIPSLSPGFPDTSGYPGSTSQTRPNPERVTSHPRRALAQLFNPFRVDDLSSRPPRVAPAPGFAVLRRGKSQPWAEGCNPFGIGAPSIARLGRAEAIRAEQCSALQAALSPAPTGRHSSAQGKAPGLRPTNVISPERASLPARADGSALSGLEIFRTPYPGLCPGLMNDGLSGLAALTSQLL